MHRIAYQRSRTYSSYTNHSIVFKLRFMLAAHIVFFHSSMTRAEAIARILNRSSLKTIEFLICVITFQKKKTFLPFRLVSLREAIFRECLYLFIFYFAFEIQSDSRFPESSKLSSMVLVDGCWKWSPFFFFHFTFAE